MLNLSIIQRALTASVAIGLLSGPATMIAQAQPTTKYTYYLVSGTSVNSLHNSMVQRGPYVSGFKAYASAQMKPNISAKLVTDGRQCRIHDLDLGMSFVINLPKLKKSAKIKQVVQRSFASFYAFAKKHEETHRSIWLKCAAEAEARMSAVRALTCNDAEAKALRVFSQVFEACNRRQEAFDAADYRRMPKLEFIKLLHTRSN